MHALRIGIIGGCLSHQPGIPLKQLYHQQLAQIALEKRGIVLRFVLDRSFDADYSERVESVARKSVDAVLLHVRPIPFLKRSRLLVRRSNGFSLNRGKEVGRDDQSSPDAESRPRRWLGDLNLLLGVGIGLHRRAIRDTMQETDRAATRATELELPLAVMGSTPYSAGRLGCWLCGRLNRSLEAGLDDSFIDLYPGWEPSYHLADGLHVSASGHTHVARRIFKTLDGTVIRRSEERAAIHA